MTENQPPTADAEKAPQPTKLVAPLLFGSGMCALIYQLTWTREFRLIFGASTAASAAVLAIFIGGLGVGGVWLGKRADFAEKPLLFYARLEVGVALLTALTPAFLWLARKVYLGLGGTTTLGLTVGTVARLLLSALVLAGPTVLMGGTLPAAARAVETGNDTGRRNVALLYGVNTLGAVTGSLLANFLMLEVFGARLTLWMACLVNLLVAVFAIRASREIDDVPATTEAPEAPAAVDPSEAPPAPFILGAAALVGFAFFLMELLWYRMLGPILGGTVFTFGLILSVALLGIGLGGAYYAFVGRHRPPTLTSFAYTCLLEALFIILPYALGDHIALLALTLRDVGKLGFWGFTFGWSIVTGLVVFPAAFVSGVQFPMLISLLGRGRQELGRQIGLTYAWNTAGAIFGSLAGGFGLLPFLGAPGSWRLIAVLLAALGGTAIGLAMRAGQRGGLLGPAALLLLVLGLQQAEGPSAFWRHSGIGAGRSAEDYQGANAIERARLTARQGIIWEKDGIESSIALSAHNALSFFVNGKSDGNALSDAGTQVMAGLLGTLLRQEDTRTALVIGLGTGSTAGWLGADPGIQRVDVVEIEPGMIEVARRFAAVNKNALDNPKVRVQLADAREVLQTTPLRYDIIFSEPSNPYRAGISSLFTQEFYKATRGRLAEQGLFLQWVQAYEIDDQTLRTIYATLKSTFPHVQTWVLDPSDLLLVASNEPQRIDVQQLRERIQREPFREALAVAWRVNDIEGVLAHFVANDRLASAVASSENPDSLNFDDLNPIEFGFARSLGQKHNLSAYTLAQLAQARGENRPALKGHADWRSVDERASSMLTVVRRLPPLAPFFSPEQIQRTLAMQNYVRENLTETLTAWEKQGKAPSDLVELAMIAEVLAFAGDERAEPLLQNLARYLPLEAKMIQARLRASQKQWDEATRLLSEAFLAYRTEPWVWLPVSEHTLQLAAEIHRNNPRNGLRLLPALSQPFAVYAQNFSRQALAFQIALEQPDKNLCVEHLKPFERSPTWEEDFLRARFACYEAVNHPLTVRAQKDLLRFLKQAGASFEAGLPPPAHPPRRVLSPAPSASAPAPSSSASAPPAPASASASAPAPSP